MENPQISGIRIYPVKALDPIILTEAEIGIHSLKNDRAFAMMAEDGRLINGKRTGMVNQLKTDYDLDDGLITFSPGNGGEKQTFELRENNESLINYLSDYFDLKVDFLHSTNGELMDIPRTSSVTVLSQASLESLQKDLPEHDLEDLRLRFRANLELAGTEAFWEDRLFDKPGTGVRFTVGEVEMIGVSPRARCNVPPRDPNTGETNKQFVKKMMLSRAQSLPDFSALPSHGNFYHLSVDTYIAENQKGKVIRVGDPVKIIEKVKLE